ncbi:MAG TPA: dihydrofolate reductase family protein [Candidatus Limnocylindrales bacterium]|nr:dihydrofolate reductase family protein [Candidatus Limnocylindrales bacterium]
MSKIVAFESVTLDGVMQAPGRPDEDTRDGFTHGGWAVPYTDAVVAEQAGSGGSGALLLGRRTYQDFYGFWPHQGDNPFTEILNNTQKYVVSTTLEEPLPWQHSTLLKGDVGMAVAALRDEPVDRVVILGSGQLVRSLMPHRLIDEYVVLIHPLVLGTGRRLFPEGTSPSSLELVDTTISTTGVIIARYREKTGQSQ